MADEFDDEILLDDDDGGSNRPFLLAAGALIGIMLLSLACFAIFNLIGGSGEEVAGEEGTAVAQVDDGSAATATAISATNEAIMTANAFVTQTIESITLTAGAPTETPTNTPVPPTNTPTNTPSPEPTETSVVEGEEGESGEEVDANDAATSIFQGLDTATPTAVSGGSGSGNGSSNNTLPETGISLWGGLAAAFGLILLIVVARRARAD